MWRPREFGVSYVFFQRLRSRFRLNFYYWQWEVLIVDISIQLSGIFIHFSEISLYILLLLYSTLVMIYGAIQEYILFLICL